MIKFSGLSRIDKAPLIEVPFCEIKQFMKIFSPYKPILITPLVDNHLWIQNREEAERLSNEHLNRKAETYKIYLNDVDLKYLLKIYERKEKLKKIKKLK